MNSDNNNNIDTENTLSKPRMNIYLFYSLYIIYWFFKNSIFFLDLLCLDTM